MDWRDRLRRALPVISGDAARDDEIREELAQHCADRFEDLRRAGIEPVEAERQVLEEVGETARRQARSSLEVVAAPASTGPGGWAAPLVQDVRYAIRLLRRAPGYTASAALTLALAVAAVTAVFSVVDGVLLRPLPYPDPDSLVFVWEVSPQGADHNVVSSGNYLAWRERAAMFESLGALSGRSNAAMTDSGEPARVSLVRVTPSALDALRIVPATGRLLSAGDGEPGGAPVVLLGHDLWRSRFGGDASVVGRTVTLDGNAFTVQGVLPRDPGLPQLDADVLVPLRFAPPAREEFRSHNYLVIGRLRPDTTRESAQVGMRAIAAAITAEHPANMTGWGVSIAPMRADLVRSVRDLLTLFMGVVVAVLLIACANLANLQMARGTGRGGEMAVRAAIGARRSRLAGQLLTESLTLSALGGVLGILLAWWLTRVLVAAAPDDIPLLTQVSFNWRVLAGALVATAGSALLVGLLPALQVSRANLQPLLHGSRVQSDAGHGRLRLGLVAAQVALALVLLTAAALFTRSFLQLGAVEHGFQPERLLTVELDLPASRYPDLQAQARFYDELLTRVRSLPGVRATAATTAFAGVGAGMTFSYALEHRPSTNPTGREDPQPLQGVSAGYFETMGIPIVEGRGFAASDDERAAPVVVINSALARLHWPDGQAIGNRLSFRPGETPWLEIVGIAGDTHDEGLDQPAPPTLYVPYAQRPASWRWMSWQNLVIRTAAEPEASARLVRDAVWDLDADLPLLEVGTMTQAFAQNAAQRRFSMQLLSAFGVLATLLGAVGIYGVLSCGVSERRREIGVRLALGARPGQVARSLLRPVMVVAAGGAVIGLAAAAALSRLIASLLFQVTPGDPLSLAAVVVVLTVVAAAAAWGPVRRAARLDPLEVLRER
jgi:predicted permease